MAAVLEAVAASSHSPGAPFLSALAAQAQARLDEASPHLPECARLACSLVAVGAAPSAAFLASLQRATLPHLRQAAVMSAPPPSAALADIAWAAAQLARSGSNRSVGFASGPPGGATPVITPSLLDPDWVASLLWSANYRVTSPRGDPFSLRDLARVLWAATALGVSPKREVVNSFVGKSQDRLSSLSPPLALDALWALSRLNTTMSSKWLNQWAMQCLSVLPDLGPQALMTCVWALGVQHPPGSPPPSQYLLKQLAACFATHLQPDTRAAEMAAAAAAPDGAAASAAAPVAAEPPLSSHQTVFVAAVMARLGVGEHSHGLPALICDMLQVTRRVISPYW